MGFANLHPHFHAIYDRNEEEGIRQFIEENSTDVLAMVAHPNNLFKRLFGTVHTKELSYQTNIPLLILPDK